MKAISVYVSDEQHATILTHALRRSQAEGCVVPMSRLVGEIVVAWLAKHQLPPGTEIATGRRNRKRT